MEWVAIVSGLVLAEYVFFTMHTGMARGRHEIPAPSTTGNSDFERSFRAQGNTVEQLIVFLPSIWLFAHYVSAPLAALLGLAFGVGRALYWRGYVTNPPRRGPGFLIGLIASSILLLGGILGALVAALSA